MKARKRWLAGMLAGCVAFSLFPAPMAQAAADWKQPLMGAEQGVAAESALQDTAAENTRQETAAKTRVTHLTTNYQTNPIGIETEKIRFAWQMDSTVIGAKQSAYQIKVFAEDGSAVWDSGKTDSDCSTGIACEGEIAERSIYRWELTVWDQAGKPYTGEASFETGVSNQQEWKSAEFICMNKSRLAPVFRTEKALEQKEIRKARLYITALGAYQAYVNGSQVGEWDEDGNLIYHHMNPGYGNANMSLGYQTYDVTSFLAEAGSAAVAVNAGTGWYNGMGNTDTSSPAVKALLMVDYADGSSQVIKTNTTDWKGTLAGGITASGIYYGEDYNGIFARELGDYTQAGYDDGAWVNAQGSGEEVGQPNPCIVNQFPQQTASYVRLLVHESGPAIESSRENLLQIMELELLDAENNNVVSNLVPDISNCWEPTGQWNKKFLTDGDLGLNSGNGYTSNMMGNSGQTSYRFAEPVSFTFNLGGEKAFETLKLYPRTSEKSVSGNECANYPKNYTLQISQDGQNWTDVDLNGEAAGTDYTVESLRNTELFPEVQAAHVDTEFGRNITAKKVRISVSQVGPAVYETSDNDKENRLQIMELELWDGTENVAAGVVPTISNNFESGTQWRAANLTDGDYGAASDAGYTSDILGRMASSVQLEEPITIEFDFAETVAFSSLRVFPRSGKDSILGGIYANYPKTYTVSVSENGTEWQEVVKEDKGMVRKQEDLQNMRMSTVTFPGVIRAQTGLPGRMTGEFDQNPVSAVVYSSTKAQSEYKGGEIDPIAEYAGADMFANGISLAKGQTMVVNMGQNLTAVPNIRFSAPCGTRARLRFAEMLNDGSEVGKGATQADGPKGSIYQKSIRNARSQATYIFAGDGVETYQPSMSFFGYQYVELTASDDMVIYGLTSKGISSVSEQIGQITTNNADVNKFFNNVLFGQLSNYYTAPTDCNQRDERLSWTGDTQAFAQTAVYNFDSYAFLQDMQEIFNENTKKNGYVAAVTDMVDTNAFFGNWAAGWSDVLIIVPWVLYQQTGDISFLADNWEYLDTYMQFLTGKERGANQCWIPNNARNYGDWLSFQGTSIEVMFDYYYGYMNQLMAQIAGILGKEEKQAAYQEKFENIKQTFLATHVTFADGDLVIKSGEGNKNYQFMYSAGKGGVWENNSQTSLLWMLKLGFYDSDEMKEAAKKLLIENIKNENPDPSSIRAQAGKNTLAVGFLGSNVITPVLTDTGNADVSYDLLLQDGLPSWLFEVKAGATTVWERWNSYTPGVGFGDSEMNSFNHYAYGSVVEWMYRYMAGISADVEKPGFKHIILQPTLDTGEKYNGEERINTVNASYESLYGRIDSSWKSEEGKLAFYHARIPANTTATLYLPVEHADLGQLPTVNGITFKGMTEHNGSAAAEFILESGGYDFTVSGGKLIPAPAKDYGNEGDNGNAGDKEDNKGDKISLSVCQIGDIPVQYYNGQKKTPGVSVKYQGKALAENTDYTIVYSNHMNIGNASVTISGKGKFTGKLTKTFVITVRKNASYTVGNYKYRITNARTDGKGTVSLTGVKNNSLRKKLKKITVAASVKIGGKSFQVTAIGNNAFKNCGKAASAEIKANVTTIGSKAFYNCKKLKKLTIRSTKLKTVGKNALQKINAKATVRVPKAKLKTYQKKLKGKGQKKTVKITALKK